MPSEVYKIFEDTYLNSNGNVKFISAHYTQGELISSIVKVAINGCERTFTGSGNGRLDAVSDALKNGMGIDYTISTFAQNAMEQSSKSKAASYIGVTLPDGRVSWGAGIHTDIIVSSVLALISALDNSGVV